MTNDRKEIADKIQKLLAKAESTGHEAEADAFRSKAEELMEKHSLSRGELDEAEFTVEYVSTGYSKTPGWVKTITANLGAFLGVFTGYDSKTTGEGAEFILGGREQDIEMLVYMAGAIKGQVEQLAKTYREENDVKRKEVNSYRIGVVQRVGHKLQEMVDNVSSGQAQEGLVLADENEEKRRKGKEAALDDTRGGFRRGAGARYQSDEARRAGHRDGAKVNVNKGAAAPDTNRQITS
jgi:hypothetical protein